ncbi:MULTISPECIES: SMP-30/gluconolactonase/LRE family protein [unclassified Saccharothrix]|uniref:SMP-30/gluconolactonase/LRE family protein n=1 Tax=unclassified Saccharothrix TaxID=2593673 RepID=UPI00307EA394
MSASPGRLLTVAALLVALTPAVATAAQEEEVIVLPGATSAEGITTGRGTSFYAGDLFAGDIYRGDLRAGTAELFIDVPNGSRMAVGMTVDEAHNLLFVAGGFAGTAYVYDLDTGDTVATYQLGAPGASLINDVTLTNKGAWFTDTANPVLYFVPVSPLGELGPHETLTLSGPAADTSGQFDNNGIAATPDGRTLIVAHTDNGVLNTVDPTTGESATIAGVSVPTVDGILWEAGRLWAVQGFLNTVVEVRLSPDLTSGEVVKTYTSPNFRIPATIAKHGNRLAVVNAKFDTGFPPTASRYEVVVFDR